MQSLQSFRSFGTSALGAQHSLGLTCPNDRDGADGHVSFIFLCSFEKAIKKAIKSIVGFDVDPPHGSRVNLGSIGALVIECPQCYEKFWFHVSPRLLESLLGYIKSMGGGINSSFENWAKGYSWE